MTEKQRHIYNFIVSHYKNHGYPPSISDIKTAFGYKHHRSVQQIIEALIRNGFLEKPTTRVFMPTYLHEYKKDLPRTPRAGANSLRSSPRKITNP